VKLKTTFVAIFALVPALSACVSHHATPPPVTNPANIGTPTDAPAEAPALYREGVELLEQNKFDESLQKLNRFIQQNPASPWYQAANFNSARALEGLKSWSDAGALYHQVVNATANAPKLQALALYRLSYIHEALADDPQVVADLTDLQPRRRYLPQEVAEGELPARLAAAYARVGSFEKAQQYYQRAEIGLARLRQKSKDLPEWLPHTLFLMGETSHSQLSWADFETYIRPLARSQVYLMQAAELNQAPWSEKAADELLQVYNDLVQTIQTATPSSGDPILAKRELQRRQWDRVALVIECLTDLRARAIAENADVPEVAKINSGLKKIDRQLSKLLDERPAGEGLTAAAIAKRKARIMKIDAANDSLEQQFLKSSREVKQALVPTETPKSEVTTETPLPNADAQPIRAVPLPEKGNEDPNL
jgi:tetratricopeptide (TPR) repeat protein